MVVERVAELMLTVPYSFHTGGSTKRMDSVLAVSVGPKLSSPLRTCQAASRSIRPLSDWASSPWASWSGRFRLLKLTKPTSPSSATIVSNVPYLEYLGIIDRGSESPRHHYRRHHPCRRHYLYLRPQS